MTATNNVRVGNLLNLSDISDLNNSSIASPTSPVEGGTDGDALRTAPFNSTLSFQRAGAEGSLPVADSHLPVGKLINISGFTEETSASVHFSSVSSSSSSLDRSFNLDPMRGFSRDGGVTNEVGRHEVAAPVEAHQFSRSNSSGRREVFDAVFQDDCSQANAGDGVALETVATPSPSHPSRAPAANSGVIDASLFDAVFAACDLGDIGRVRVSQLVNYITGITNADEQNYEGLVALQVWFFVCVAYLQKVVSVRQLVGLPVDHANV